jgi:hypothetical protein
MAMSFLFVSHPGILPARRVSASHVAVTLCSLWAQNFSVCIAWGDSRSDDVDANFRELPIFEQKRADIQLSGGLGAFPGIDWQVGNP